MCMRHGSEIISLWMGDVDAFQLLLVKGCLNDQVRLTQRFNGRLQNRLITIDGCRDTIVFLCVMIQHVGNAAINWNVFGFNAITRVRIQQRFIAKSGIKLIQ